MAAMCSPGRSTQPVMGERERARPPLLQPLQGVPPGVEVHLGRGRRRAPRRLRAGARPPDPRRRPDRCPARGRRRGGRRDPGSTALRSAPIAWPSSIVCRLPSGTGRTSPSSSSRRSPKTRRVLATSRRGVGQVRGPAGVDVDRQLRPALPPARRRRRRGRGARGSAAAPAAPIAEALEQALQARLRGRSRSARPRTATPPPSAGGRRNAGR